MVNDLRAARLRDATLKANGARDYVLVVCEFDTKMNDRHPLSQQMWLELCARYQRQSMRQLTRGWDTATMSPAGGAKKGRLSKDCRSGRLARRQVHCRAVSQMQSSNVD